MDVNPQSEICVPHKLGKIRIKVLKLPKGVSHKNIIQNQNQKVRNS